MSSPFTRKHNFIRIAAPTPKDPRDYYLTCIMCGRDVSRDEYWKTPNDCVEHLVGQEDPRSFTRR
jgi:hypothetical protein